MRLQGIEPWSRPWQGRILPLNHSRKRVVNEYDYQYSENVYKSNIKNEESTEQSCTLFDLVGAPKKLRLFFCAPTRIRTQTNCSEDSRDIHFTIGATVENIPSFGHNIKSPLDTSRPILSRYP